jgi:hypothetical protein
MVGFWPRRITSALALDWPRPLRPIGRGFREAHFLNQLDKRTDRLGVLPRGNEIFVPAAELRISIYVGSACF